MNAESSRSHLILGIVIESTNLTSGVVVKGKVRETTNVIFSVRQQCELKQTGLEDKRGVNIDAIFLSYVTLKTFVLGILWSTKAMQVGGGGGGTIGC